MRRVQQPKLTAKEKKAIDLYNTCGVAYAYIQKSSFELIDPYADDPNMAYKFKNPNNKAFFMKAVYDMRNALNKFDIYALPDAVFRTAGRAKDIVNNYKIWSDDIDILYAVAKREDYLKQIKGNILMITNKAKDVIQKRHIPIENITRQEMVLALGATVLNIRAITQNEPLIKSIIKLTVSDKNLEFILRSYLDMQKKLVVKPSDVNLYESVNESEKSDIYDSIDDIVMPAKITGISTTDTLTKQGCVKYDREDNDVKAVGYFERGDIIETAPVRVLDKQQYEAMMSYMSNADIYFEIVKDRLWGLPLGYIPVYMYTNKRELANAYFRYSPSESCIRVIALKDIPADTEIVVLNRNI